MKLWQKGMDVDKLVESFTVGNDYVLDQELISYDCDASTSHAQMLGKIEVLTSEEVDQLVQCLSEIKEKASSGDFAITLSDEDGHTAIENYLVAQLGDVGKKIHTGRSRNDQVLVALRLYMKDKIGLVLSEIDSLIASIEKSVANFGSVGLPGYTHMQKAMPATISMWFGSYIDSLNDSKKQLEAIVGLIDTNPLGSAAGFGVPVFELNREMTTSAMGFSYVQENPMACQSSRGKYESMVVDSLVSVMMDLNKISSDLILFSMDEFGYFSLPASLCTGSSIMPQKKNPDVLELVRAKYSVVLGHSTTIRSLYAGLISGYNRDMQLVKDPLFGSFETVLSSLSIVSHVFSGLSVDSEKCKAGLTPEVYATEEAYKLVKSGMSFRDAYKEVGKKFS